ncbi:hypothetical protein I6J40_34220 [Streptomyces californicus]|nr:hypothetical protein I6J40_34220 [Streptomyces californicus]
MIQQIVARQTAVRPERGMVSCPASIAELLWSELPQDSGLLGLEPSAGHGALAAEGARLGYSVDCYEVEGHRAADITRAGVARSVSVADFLTVEPRPEYHAVAMYPPHRINLAAAHVLHAYNLMRPGGVLGALVSCGIENGAGPAARRLKELLGSNGHHPQALDEVDAGGDDFLLLSPGAAPYGHRLCTSTPTTSRPGGGRPGSEAGTSLPGRTRPREHRNPSTPLETRSMNETPNGAPPVIRRPQRTLTPEEHETVRGTAALNFQAGLIMGIIDPVPNLSPMSEAEGEWVREQVWPAFLTDIDRKYPFGFWR